MRAVLRALTLGLALTGGGLVEAQAQQSAPPIRYIIVDSSGSMDGDVDGRKKIEIAKDIVRSEVDSLAPNQSVALLKFGADRAKACQSIDVPAPVGSQAQNRPLIRTAIENMQPSGGTPVAASIQRALADASGRPVEIVLITDGIDSCNRNVCGLVQNIRSARATIAVRGVGMAPETVDAWSCLAQPIAAAPESKPSATQDLRAPNLEPATTWSEPVHWRTILALLLLATLLISATFFLVRLIIWLSHSAGGAKGAPLAELGLTLLSLGGLSLAFNFSGPSTADPVWTQVTSWSLTQIWLVLDSSFMSAIVPAALIAFVGYAYKDMKNDREDAEAISGARDEADVRDRDVEEEVQELRQQQDYGSFQNASTDIDAIKHWVRDQIEKLKEIDGRRARKYQKLSGYDYRAHLELLQKDAEAEKRFKLDDQLVSDALRALTLWRPFSTARRQFPKEVENVVRGVANRMKGAIPPEPR